MGLQLWLPLIRDTENQGLITSTITNTNVTANTAGKLGGCYSFDGSSSYLMGTNPPLDNNSTEWSYCCWVKFATLSQDQCLYSNRTSTKSTGITVFYDDGGNILMDDGVRWTVALTTPFVVDTWYHICVTRKAGSKKCLYINGVLQSSTTTTGTQSTAGSTRFSIGASQNASTTVNGNYLNGSLNDVRVYDYELSPKEVAEIAKGLVLHYPLNGNGRGGDNLLANSIPTSTSGWGKSGTDWTYALVNAEGSLNGKAIRATYGGTGTTRGGIYHKYTSSYESFEDGVYTLTARIRASLPCRVRLYNRTFGVKYVDVTTEWATYSVTGDTNKASYTDANSYILIESAYVSQGVWIECCMMKFEKGSKSTPWIPYTTDAAYTAMGYDSTTEYDTSGFGYNGTKGGTFTYDSDTPKYSVSTVFNGTDARINCGRAFHVQGAKNISFSCWAWCEDYTTSDYKYFISSQQTGGILLGYHSGTTARGRVRAYTAADLSTNGYRDAEIVIPLSGWHMFTCTYDTSAIKIYIDGELKTTYTAKTYGVHFNTSAVMFIGAESNGSSSYTDPFTGKLSDVRIYYTTLTADQVKELYETTASIANNGTLLTNGEFVES